MNIDLILINAIRQGIEGCFDPEAIRKKWSEYLLGKRNWAPQLWTILMFQLWLRAQKDN